MEGEGREERGKNNLGGGKKKTTRTHNTHTTKSSKRERAGGQVLSSQKLLDEMCPRGDSFLPRRVKRKGERRRADSEREAGGGRKVPSKFARARLMPLLLLHCRDVSTRGDAERGESEN